MTRMRGTKATNGPRLPRYPTNRPRLTRSPFFASEGAMLPNVLSVVPPCA
jgi:hypothetical protein